MREKRFVLFDGTSGQSSTYTSNDFFVGDFNILGLSVETSSASASRYTLQSSFEEGYGASLNTRSVVSTIVAKGVYTIDPGLRWVRCQRGSQDSLSEVVIQAIRS